VKKVESGVTVFYVRSSVMKQTGFEVGGNGALYRANVYAGSQKLIGQLSPDGQFHWQHTNHLGSVQKMTNSGGAVVYRGEYDPHGNVLLETGSTTLNSHKFTGYEKDQSTGLDYANARMYSGSRGRFTKPDPIGLKAGNRRKPQSLNLYTYVGNDPANLVDTGGRCSLYWNQVSETYGYWDDIGCDPYTPPHHSIPLDGFDPYAEGSAVVVEVSEEENKKRDKDVQDLKDCINEAQTKYDDRTRHVGESGNYAVSTGVGAAFGAVGAAVGVLLIGTTTTPVEAVIAVGAFTGGVSGAGGQAGRDINTLRNANDDLIREYTDCWAKHQLASQFYNNLVTGYIQENYGRTRRTRESFNQLVQGAYQSANLFLGLRSIVFYTEK
jgi:RHS repeat-associated protein